MLRNTTEITEKEYSWQEEQECRDLGKDMTEVCETSKKAYDTRREDKGSNSRVGKNNRIRMCNDKLCERFDREVKLFDFYS